MTDAAMQSPSPVPSSFVVKKGSKIRCWTSGSIPLPESAIRTAIISRPPDTGKTQDDLRQYWRALASVITDQPVMIQTTARRGGVSPSTELLIELAKEFPNFGYVKEESNPVIPRIAALLASPSIRSVFSARGAYGWLYESRLGTEGLVTERIAYADILAKIWKLMRSGSDPEKLKDMYS